MNLTQLHPEPDITPLGSRGDESETKFQTALHR